MFATRINYAEQGVRGGRMPATESVPRNLDAGQDIKLFRRNPRDYGTYVRNIFGKFGTKID